ncbi:single-stranded DNA-binding protein [Chlamydiales bacterium]|nr:single-stranded DNA-binding protein [Chlamydiales bacterium]
MNIIEVIGNLGKDPEVRYTPSGQKVTNLTIASNSKRGGKEETTWYRITIWGDRFDKMISFLKKGSLIMVVGELHKPEIFTGRDGQSQISLEVTAEMLRFLPSRVDKQGQGESASAPNKGMQEPDFGSGTESVSMGQGAFVDQGNNEESDIPF